MNKEKKELVEKLFSDDLKSIQHEIIAGKHIRSYCMYVEFENPDGSTMGLTAFNSSDIPALIGRLELIKHIAVEKYNQEHPDPKPSQDLLDVDIDPAVQALKNFIIKNKDKPN